MIHRPDQPPIPIPEQEIKMEKIFPSQDLQNAYKNLSITTSPEFTRKLLDDKTKMLIEVLQSGRLPQDILKTYETIYVSSGIDIELPLCLGARKITLVDPELSDEAIFQSLLSKINALDAQAIVFTEKEKTLIRFNFDFGKGKENVSIKIEPKIFGKEHAAHHKDGEPYELPNEVGLVLGYRTQDALINDSEVRDKLVPGGVVLVDDLTMTVHEYYEETEKISNSTTMLPDEIKAIAYKKRGYEYVPLKTNSDRGWKKSFLIKTA
jgi:hypothetical protein